MVVNRGTEEVLVGNPCLDEVMVLEKGSLAAQWRFLSQLRSRRFDAVIDLTDGDRSALLSWMSGAPVRIGFNDEQRFRGSCYTAIVHGPPGAHRIERDLASLAPLGIKATDKQPKMYLTVNDREVADRLLNQFAVRTDRPIVVIQPGARYWFKAWPAERFAELADRLAAECHCQVLIGGSVEEMDLARCIIEKTAIRPISFAGLSTIRQFASIVERAALFIGNDTGAMHIAASVGTPIVALFGPSNPNEWGPRGGNAEIIYKGLDCRECFHPTCMRGEQSCMKLISVEEVFSAAVRLLVRQNSESIMHRD